MTQDSPEGKKWQGERNPGIQQMRGFLQPPLRASAHDAEFPFQWSPEGGWSLYNSVISASEAEQKLSPDADGL